MADFDNAEFIALVKELMTDASTATIIIQDTPVFNRTTLTAGDATPQTATTKIVFIAPNNSTQIMFEREIVLEDSKEHKVAVLDYRGDISPGKTKIDVPGLGVFTVTAVIAVSPLGVVLFQRVKMSR